MANEFTIGSASDYPKKHNKRELKVIETTRDDAKKSGSYLAAAAADYAITDTDGFSTFVVNDAITITLPAVATNVGRVITFTQIGTATLTIAQNADGAEIAGADADYTALDAGGDTATLICDGVAWFLGFSSIA